MKYCHKCGNRISDNAAFCKVCGERILRSQRQESLENELQNNKKRINSYLIAAVIVIFVLICLVGFVLIKKDYKNKKYEDLMERAERYLEELNYESAEALYLEAIIVDPKQPKPYLDLADIYIIQDDFDKAEAILEEAKENVEKENQEEIEEKLTEIEHIKEMPEVEDNTQEAEQEKTEPDETVSEKTELLLGSWLQEESTDPIRILFEEDEMITYYASFSQPNIYNTMYSFEEDKLRIDLVNLDGSGVTSILYDIEFSEENGMNRMCLSYAEENASTDATLLYGYETVLLGWYTKEITAEDISELTEEQLKEICMALGVPDTLAVEVKQGTPEYWDAGECYLTYVQVFYNNEEVASASVNSVSGELIRNIKNYIR